MNTLWSTSDTTVPRTVQLGVWTNWSRGRVLGVTLTIERDTGNLLIAFTAFFVGVVAARFWRIACFVLHRSYSTNTARDAFHHQRQAILRNSANAEGAAWEIAQLSWAWHRTARHALLRASLTFLLAVVCVCSFALASGYSSRVSTGIGSQVLIDGSSCGLLNTAGQGAVTTDEAWELVNTYRRNVAENAANYAQQCYSMNNTSVFDCNTFVVNALPGTVEMDAACPFQGNICGSNTSNIRLDTGYISTHTHFGLNAPENEAILFRHVFHCAPLMTDGYKNNSVGENTTYTRYYYGRAIGGSGQNDTVDYAFEVETRLSTNDNGTTDMLHSHFIPIPEIQRRDADIYLNFIIGNGVIFGEPTDDPWYRGTLDGAIIGPSQGYMPEEAASPMGCVEQYQFCNSEQQCGPLAGLSDAVYQAAPVFGLTTDDLLNHRALGTPGSRLLWFANILSISGANPADIMWAQGAHALLSLKSLLDGVIIPRLQPNHWQLDVTHWWTTWLAYLQTSFVATATGPMDPQLEPYRLAPADDFQREMCNGQKIRSTQYSSFSLFGLCFIFTAGALIIIISYILEPICQCLQRRRGYDSYKNLEWTANEALHLRCLSYGATGRGSRSNWSSAVPITQKGETLEPVIFRKVESFGSKI
ncbi:hypothetical protein GQ53DRAFT_663302 [Thozetella sp. PMI_491]|nr:hypothetical protein GQ53DRAFT_663302 [Thozetella sp. PMI_491]